MLTVDERCEMFELGEGVCFFYIKKNVFFLKKLLYRVFACGKVVLMKKGDEK